MRKLLSVFVLSASLIGRTAIAETVGLANGPNISGVTADTSSALRGLRLAMPVPVEPQGRDTPIESRGDIEDRAVDRKLTIYRGC